MNTLHFKYAIEVERTRSITQAAENLFMGQPNLSKAIKELEDTLGFVIFQRTSKGVAPTAKGSEFLVYARNILAQLEKMESLSDAESADTQQLSVSIPRSSYISGAVTRFVASLSPERAVQVNIQEAGAMQTIAHITDGQFDLGVIRCGKEHETYFLDYLSDKQLEHEPLWDFEKLVLFSNRHPLAQAPLLHAEDLSAYLQITHSDHAVPYLTPTAPRKEPGRGIRCVQVQERCGQFDLLAEIEGAYMWTAPVPDSWLERFGLVQRVCLGAPQCRDMIVYPKGHKFTVYERRFVDLLFEAKNDVALRDYA